MSSIGAKREMIAVERKTRTQRDDKGWDATTAQIAQRWAHFQPLQDREQLEAGRQAPRTQYLVTLANLTDVTEDDTLIWLTNSNARLNIKQVRRPERREQDMEILAELGPIT